MGATAKLAAENIKSHVLAARAAGFRHADEAVRSDPACPPNRWKR